MLLRKLIWTVLLLVAYVVAILCGDFSFNSFILHTPAGFTPTTDILLTLLVGTPFTFFLVGQRFDLKKIISDRERLSLALEQALSEAEAATRAKADFLANMTHELRTPLNAISGFSGLLKQSDRLDERDAHHVALIESASQALLHVVNDVLDFSKLEAGALELDHQPFDAAELVRSSTAILSQQADAKDLKLSVEIIGDIGEVVGDAARLRQVLLNLLSNAIKFTASGAVKVVVAQCGPEDESDTVRTLRVEVIDQGIGIPEDQIDKIFGRFAQADASVTRRFGGTGLGLSISKRIVETMGGEIGAISWPGVGSNFWFEVPLRVAAACNADDGVNMAGLTIKPGLRLLAADDHTANRELLCALLAPFGIEIETVDDGVAAVEAAARADFDIILMDVQMPVMDGLTATQHIRAAGRPHTSIIAMTANVLPEQIARCLAAGMDDHIGKPINPSRLLEAIAHWSAAPEQASERSKATAAVG
jgi:signal transduction histidine kinase/CheY-like chemotaxis protein